MMQFCFPKNNEEEFVKIAIKLGIKELCFVYDKVDKAKSIKAKIKIYTANFRDSNADFLIAEHSEKDRNLIESGKIDLLYNLELEDEKDFMHSRNSGFNHILAALCNEKKVKIVFNFNLLLNSYGKDRVVLLGRMRQNMALCRKYKVSHMFSNFVHKPIELRNEHCLDAFERLL